MSTTWKTNMKYSEVQCHKKNKLSTHLFPARSFNAICTYIPSIISTYFNTYNETCNLFSCLQDVSLAFPIHLYDILLQKTTQESYAQSKRTRSFANNWKDNCEASFKWIYYEINTWIDKYKFIMAILLCLHKRKELWN